MGGERAAYVVTGSASGIGAAVARDLARRGAAVAVNYRANAAGAEAVARECRAAGGEALVVRADVAADGDCRRLAEAALSRFGRIDGLVNNAGTTRFAPMADLAALSAEDFLRIYSVNVVAAYQMIRACREALRAARGSVVNVSSIAGTLGIGSSTAYACSKGALNTLTVAMARTLGPDIRVNAVLPGFTETRWLEDGLGDGYGRVKDAYRAQSALGATLAPEDVAAAVVSLLLARGTTGQLLAVDGGRTVGAP